MAAIHERRPGRPAVGPPVNVRLGEALPRVDRWAAAHDVSRAEAVRQLVERGLIAAPVDEEVG